MRRKTLLVIAAAAASLSLQAQGVAFLNINPDAASVGLAETSIARQADAYAMENNIAATTLGGTRMAFAAGFGIWQPKANKSNVLSAAGFYRISNRLALGMQFKNFSYQEYSNVSADGRVRDTFRPAELTAGLGISYRIADGFSVGASFRFISSTLASDAKASAFGADIAVKYEKDGWHAGFSVCNLGTPVSYGGDKYAQPAMVRGGGAYSTGTFTASAEVDYLFQGGLMAGLGVEYTIADIVSLRGGFHYGDAAKAIPMYASLGLGVQFAGVHLDAAFLLASKTLGNSLMFGLGYSF